LLYTTTDYYCAATGVCPTTAGRRLTETPFRLPSLSRGRRFYPLAAALQTLRKRENDAGAIESLVRTSRTLSDDLYIEPDALPLAHSFSEWLPAPAMRDRLRSIQNALVVAVANSRLCTPTIVRNLDALRQLFPLNPDAMRWILVRGDAPDVDNLGPAFAVACNDTALDIYTTSLKEVA
jgi:hypothetical protein